METQLGWLYKQAYECIDSAYKRGYDDGRIDASSTDTINELRQAEYQKGFEDGNKIADKDLKEIQDSTYDVAYNKALKDVDHAIDVLKSMTGTECAEWFKDCVGVGRVVCEFTIQQIIKSIKAYEEKTKAEDEDKVKVGDEVKYVESERTIIVTKIHNDNYFDGVDLDGEVYSCRNPQLWIKTGRHFEVEQLFAKLRGEEE